MLPPMTKDVGGQLAGRNILRSGTSKPSNQPRAFSVASFGGSLKLSRAYESWDLLRMSFDYPSHLGETLITY